MKKQSIFYGLFFIGIAALLLGSSMGLIEFDYSVWTIALGLLFFAMLVHSIFEWNYVGIVYSLAFLYLTFQGPMNLPEVGFFTMMIVGMFLSIGLSFLIPTKYKFRHERHKNQGDKKYKNSMEAYHDVVDEEREGSIFFSNHFGASSKYINSTDFKHAILENNFGEMKVFFDNAAIINGTASVEIQASFGKVELYIPRDWSVNHNVNVFLANVKERTRMMNGSGPSLSITGNLSFGEISIIYT